MLDRRRLRDGPGAGHEVVATATRDSGSMAPLVVDGDWLKVRYVSPPGTRCMPLALHHLYASVLGAPVV